MNRLGNGPLNLSHPVRVFLIRHAQSAANEHEHLICGRSNLSPLTEIGQRQSRLLGKRIASECVAANTCVSSCPTCEGIPRVDRIYSSTAERAKHTAAITVEYLMQHCPSLFPAGAPSIIESDALCEQSQGEWEGSERIAVYTAEVRQQMKDQHVHFCAPGGESIAQVSQRAANYLIQQIQSLNNVGVEMQGTSPLCICMFVHGMVIRGLLWYFLNIIPQYVWRIALENTSITEILLEVDNKPIALRRMNDYAHLVLLKIEDQEQHEQQSEQKKCSMQDTAQ